MCVNDGMATLSPCRQSYLLDFILMPVFRSAVIARLSSALILMGALACARGAELGDPVVRSHIGQPLVADVELTTLADPAQAVTVRLASPDVYKGANVAMHPALASLNMSVMRRDGRQFLHITSVRPVDAEYIHLFVELAEGGKRNIRAATLWLTQDPTPAPPPAPIPVPAPVIAKPAVPVPVAAKPVEPPPVAKAPAIVLRQPSAPAACPQPFSAEQIKACAAIDYKNGLLSAQIVELEEKVKALQVAMAARSEPAEPPKPVVKRIPPPLAALPKPAPKPEHGFPWLLVSGVIVLLAAIGGAVFFVLSRRKSKSVETAAADSVAWYARLAGRLRRKPKVAAEAEVVAPDAA